MAELGWPRGSGRLARSMALCCGPGGTAGPRVHGGPRPGATGQGVRPRRRAIGAAQSSPWRRCRAREAAPWPRSRCGRRGERDARAGLADGRPRRVGRAAAATPASVAREIERERERAESISVLVATARTRGGAHLDPNDGGTRRFAAAAGRGDSAAALRASDGVLAARDCARVLGGSRTGAAAFK